MPTEKQISDSFDTFGVMIDCSRDAVYKKETLFAYIDTLSKIGYNMLMLYTEDVYEVKGEPYFGYLRGRYTVQELRELDAYARSRGIELIPCIQTLAHLGGITRWQNYLDYTDEGDVLLAGEDCVYELIDRMFASLAESFTSRRVHIGMDEAGMIGLGRYLHKHGYQDRSEILCRHLAKVVEIAGRYGFSPIMWSDMFFRLANNGQYYVKDAEISEKVSDMVPKGVDLVYWDYYSTDKTHYDEMFSAHERAFRNRIWFAGGAWSWNGFAPNNSYSLRSVRASIESCREKGIRNIFITEWKDDGAECSLFSTLPALVYASECACGRFETGSRLKDKFRAVTGMEFDDFMALDLPNGDGVEKECVNPSKYALFSDPFLGVFDYSLDTESRARFEGYRDRLEKLAGNERYGYIFATLAALCDALSVKYGLGIKTRELYRRRDRKALAELARTDYEELTDKLKKLYEAFRTQWEKESKPNGFEKHDIRLGGLICRVGHCRKMLLDYAEGKIPEISALDEEILPFMKEAEKGKITIGFNSWMYTAMIKPMM